MSVVNLIRTSECVLDLKSRQGLPSVILVEVRRVDRLGRPCHRAAVEAWRVIENGTRAVRLDRKEVSLSAWHSVRSFLEDTRCGADVTLWLNNTTDPVFFRVTAPEDGGREVGRSVHITLNQMNALPGGSAQDERPTPGGVLSDVFGGLVRIPGDVGRGFKNTVRWASIGAVALAAFAYSDQIKGAGRRVAR